MKPYLLVIALIICQVSLAQKEIKFEVESSNLYATYDFIQKLSSYYPDNALKTAYQNSKYMNEENNGLIKTLEAITLDYHYSFSQYLPTLKMNFDSRSQIELNLANSLTIGEFKEKSFGLILNDDLILVSEILATYLPIYNDLIFDPLKDDFRIHLAKINRELNSNQVPQIFKIVSNFYGTNWDMDIPLKIIVLPSLENGSMSAKAIKNLSIIEFPMNSTNYNDIFSVMLHELSHILYDNQPFELKNQLKECFDNSSSRNSLYAFQLLNEALATALGNGYAYEELAQQVDQNDWYNKKYVNLIAKEIYPLIKAYISHGKTIDEDFVNAYLDIYDNKFSDWYYELDNIFTYVAVLCENSIYSSYFQRNYFSSYHFNYLGITPNYLFRLEQLPLTKIIVVSENHSEKLKMIGEIFEEVKLLQLDPQREFVHAISLKDRSILFLVNLHSSSLETLLSKEYNNRKVNPSNIINPQIR